MSLKAKIIAVLIAAIALFSTGTWVGYQILKRSPGASNVQRARKRLAYLLSIRI